MNTLTDFSAPARGLIVAAAFALVVIVLKMASSLLAPILLATFIAIVVTPVLGWMRGKGVPKWAALVVIGFVLIDIGSLLALVTSGAVEGFRNSIPTYQDRLTLLVSQLGNWLEAVGMDQSGDAVPNLLDPSKLMVGVRLLLSNASGIFANGLLVLLTVIFILLEAPTLWAKLHAAFSLTPEGEERIRRLFSSINRYMQIKAATSFATGVCAYVLLWLLGVDFAIFWAILAFFLNFIPVVGNIIMMIPPALLALVQADLSTALMVIIGYLVINTAIGNIIEPRIMGKGLGISTLAVFLALLFWGWLFGSVGMFLAVPLTVTLVIALDASPTTRPIAILLGPEVETMPPPDQVNQPVLDAVAMDEPTDHGH
ncbi:MAG: AI-2E family transporter [Lamprobacter sp.]|uniref:AI-2E family transporter n=1 Tax=Lamprobacter sp. TaxID=3100796 RepID=UPI002B263B56|nr:AI-2E family transporter [Lamprobacter sp.]MEA3639979.1 AI-2E family transporter [Lamprobacter sp.]